MGPLTLPTSGLVYLDANGLIYSVERVEPYRTLLQPMWEQEADMELYQLDYVLHEPREDQGWLYMAEIPELPGCRAWGGERRRDPVRAVHGSQAIHSLLQRPREIPSHWSSAVPDRTGQVDSQCQL